MLVGGPQPHEPARGVQVIDHARAIGRRAVEQRPAQVPAARELDVDGDCWSYSIITSDGSSDVKSFGPRTGRRGESDPCDRMLAEEAQLVALRTGTNAEGSSSISAMSSISCARLARWISATNSSASTGAPPTIASRTGTATVGTRSTC